MLNIYTYMPPEIFYQVALFTGELVDTRTRKQRELDEAQRMPCQAELFSQRDLAQFGVIAHPQLPLSPKTSLKLTFQDPRTPEEKTRDVYRDLEKHTYPLELRGEERPCSCLPERNGNE